MTAPSKASPLRRPEIMARRKEATRLVIELSLAEYDGWLSREEVIERLDRAINDLRSPVTLRSAS
jgi:hypothetical protein